MPRPFQNWCVCDAEVIRRAAIVRLNNMTTEVANLGAENEQWSLNRKSIVKAMLSGSAAP